MSKGETLSYYRDNSVDVEMAGLFVKYEHWLFVGIYTKVKLAELIRRDYSNYPSDCIKIVSLP